MTRFLSDSLQAEEPFFRLGLRRLELANGLPNTDIRFSLEVMQTAKSKLLELGLDPSDTSAEELYEVLRERIKTDDARLTKNLRTQAANHISAEGDVIAGMIHAIKQLPDSRRCFALKNSRLKSIIRKIPPKKAMKRLGYRSVESFLKHETGISILTAAWLCEGKGWQQHLLEQYKKLKPDDFEHRSIAVVQFNSTRWHDLAAATVVQQKHNILCFKELGSVVFLPFPAKVPAGAVTVSLALALHELNEIRSCSTFLKLCQVRPDFGEVVHKIAEDEPASSSQLLDQPVPWHLIQRYYARLSHLFRKDLFEPHIQVDDMIWLPIEKSLSAIEPSLAFWHDSAHLGILHDGKPVSMNIIDTALNCCNKLTFRNRAVHYFQHSLIHELLLRYLRHEPVEQSILSELQPQLAAETVLA